jgi:hypothetical protein
VRLKNLTLYLIFEVTNLENKRKFLVVFLILFLIVSLCSVWLFVSNNRPQGEKYKEIADQLLIEAKQEFEKIRRASFEDVNLVVVNQSWVIENWGTPFIDPEETLIEENIYKGLLMISQDIDLYEVKLGWIGMFHAAKWNGKIYVVEERFDVTNEFKATSTFVHELTHIAQEDYSLPSRTKFDGSKALSSLKEGDATLMANTFKNDGIVPEPASILKSISSSIPEAIDKLNRFVYRYGLEFVKQLYNYDENSWSSINEAYKNPPNTTEQIIHIEKYLQQENALTVQPTLVEENWNLNLTEHFGEYFILVMLDKWLPVESAELAAEGWGGDLFNYYENGDDFLFTWDILWDSNEDANEFYNTFKEMMEKTSVDHLSNDTWQIGERYLSIDINQNWILIKNSPNES